MLKSDVLAHPLQDDGFHEIQLNGKQLVFLFMAATVVSVVIFLCGVLVGRGVRAERGSALAEASLSAAPPEPAMKQPPAATSAPADSDPTEAAPPPAVDDLSYFNRLESQTPPVEELKEAPAKSEPAVAAEPTRAAEARASKAVLPSPKPAAAEKPVADETKTPAAPAADPSASPSTNPPASGPGWAVQIAALTVRGDAEAIAKRLSSKGYAAYVLEPASGTPTVYRVKVGKFPTKGEAEVVASKLQKEEQFKPWVTR